MNLSEYVDLKREEHLNDLFEFLRIPSVSAQTEHKPDIERAAKWVAEQLRGAGLDKIEIVPTKMHPLVYGESLHAPGKPTILVLRTLRCAAGRAAGPVDLSAVRTDDSRTGISMAAARPTTKGRSTFTSARSTRS